MTIKHDNVCTITCTDNDKVLEVEVDNFKDKESMDIYVATNRIKMRWNGRTYVGNSSGLEFTTLGPKTFNVKNGRY
jgi:hypothetical protein